MNDNSSVFTYVIFFLLCCPGVINIRDENLPLFGGNPLFSLKITDLHNLHRSVEFFFRGG